MKKQTFFLAVAMVTGFSIHANAQWGTSATQTWTPYNVGIGAYSLPTDATLLINNDGGAGIPALKITRDYPAMFPVGYVYPNQFELWSQAAGPLCFPTPCPPPPPVLIDVIDKNGWYGILTPVPIVPLDVNGNGLVRNSLAVYNNLTIGAYTSPITPDATIDAYTGYDLPALKITRWVPGSMPTGAVFGNHLEIWDQNQAPLCFPTPCPPPPPVLLDEFDAHGWLGILNSNPTQPLDVNGNGLIQKSLTVGIDLTVNHDATIQNNLTVHGGLIDMIKTGGDTWRTINANSNFSGITLTSGSGSSIEMAAQNEPSTAGNMTFISKGTTLSPNNGYNFYYNDGNTYNDLVHIYNNGKVTIGAELFYWGANGTDPSLVPEGYLLYVKKGILTERLKVSLTSTSYWSDFVFATDYNLMPLSKVESYIKVNKHLPEVPSATEIVKSGIDVATMDAKLLQKIEELTLYVINQNKKMDKQQRQMEEQKNEINLLKKRMN